MTAFGTEVAQTDHWERYGKRGNCGGCLGDPQACPENASTQLLNSVPWANGKDLLLEPGTLVAIAQTTCMVQDVHFSVWDMVPIERLPYEESFEFVVSEKDKQQMFQTEVG